MNSKEILDKTDQVLSLLNYKIIEKDLLGTHVAIDSKSYYNIYVYNAIDKEHLSEERIKYEIKKLCDIRDNFTSVKLISLPDNSESININFILLFDVEVPTNLLLLLNNYNIKFLIYGDKKHSSIEVFGSSLQTKAIPLKEFSAYTEYVESIIKYIRKVLASKYDVTVNNMIEIPNIPNYSSPRELANEVKKYVIGQDAVIDDVAIPFFQHIESMRNGTTCEIKTSFIIAGNTGTGKSEMLRRFAQVTGVPIIRINTADCSPASWKGLGISDHISYYINSQEDVEKLRYSVLVFNEFDKITHYNQNTVSSNNTDWVVDMQREFLRFYDKGYEILIEKNTSDGIKKFRLPTDNLLLCYDGAYSGIDKIIEKRLNKHAKIGYNIEMNDMKFGNLSELTMEDLEKWGYLPELLGRIGSYFVMKPMSEELIYQIITKASENILESHIKQCEQYGITVEFGEEALRYIASEAMKSKLGFRTVKTLLAKILKNIYFDCDKYSGKRLLVDKEFIINNTSLN